MSSATYTQAPVLQLELATSDRFISTFGVRQDCGRVPAIFCCAIELITGHMSGLKGIIIGRYTVTDLDYADDIAQPASQLSDLETCLSGFSAATEPWAQCVLAKDEGLCSVLTPEVFRQTSSLKATWWNRSNPSAILAASRTHPKLRYPQWAPSSSLSRICKQEKLLLPNKALSIHDVQRSCSLVPLGVADPLGLEYQSSGGFPYALSETDSACKVAR